jgi:hypothetical protein
VKRYRRGAIEPEGADRDHGAELRHLAPLRCGSVRACPGDTGTGIMAPW